LALGLGIVEDVLEGVEDVLEGVEDVLEGMEDVLEGVEDPLAVAVGTLEDLGCDSGT
jgi:hypothetical protein